MIATCLARLTTLLALVTLQSGVIDSGVPQWACDVFAPDDSCLKSHNMNLHNVSESESIGTTLYTLAATDPNPENNTQIIYTIENTDPANLMPGSKDGFDYFEVNAISGQVKLKTLADYEEFTEIRPTWRVTSGIHYIVTFVIVPLTDANDNNPEFQGTPYVIEGLAEDTGVGEIVFTVSATDADASPDFSDVTYHIIDDLAGYICETSMFTIDATRGLIILVGSLSYKVQPEFTVCLQARDQGIPYKSDNASLRVSVLDVQGDPPIFFNTPYVRYLQEDLDLGTEIITVSAVDGDFGAKPTPNTVEFELVSGDDDGDFTLTSLGVLTLSKALDRERRDNYTLEVKATEVDATQPAEQITSFETITLSILDVNDNKPVFVPSTEAIQLMENIPEGTSLPLEMTVTDFDKDANAHFKLSLSDEVTGTFQLKKQSVIGSAKVEIIVVDNTLLDRERYSNLPPFQVIATETGSSEPASMAEVTVILQDVNDNPPVFETGEYKCVFNQIANENSTLDICEVKAFDADVEEVNQDMYYAIVNNTNGMFKIDPKFGNISLIGEMGKDEKTELLVMVNNTAPPHFTDATTVTIQVEFTPKEPVAMNLALILGVSIPAGVLFLFALVLLVCVVKKSKSSKSQVGYKSTDHSSISQTSAWKEEEPQNTPQGKQNGHVTTHQTNESVDEDERSMSPSNPRDEAKLIRNHESHTSLQSSSRTANDNVMLNRSHETLHGSDSRPDDMFYTENNIAYKDDEQNETNSVELPGVIQDSQADVKGDIEVDAIPTDSMGLPDDKDSSTNTVPEVANKDIDSGDRKDSENERETALVDTAGQQMPLTLPPINSGRDHTNIKGSDLELDPALIENSGLPDDNDFDSNSIREVQSKGMNDGDRKSPENEKGIELTSELSIDKHEDIAREQLSASPPPTNTPDNNTGNRVARGSKKKKKKKRKKDRKVNEPTYVMSIPASESPADLQPSTVSQDLPESETFN